MNGMIFEEFEVRNVITCLSNENMAEVMERIECFLLETFMNLVENISELKVIDSSIELKSNKIARLESIHTFEQFFFVNGVCKDNLKVALDCLHKIRLIDISKLIFPNINSIGLKCWVVEASPEAESCFSISEDNIQETYYSIPLTLFLFLLLTELFNVS